jgi:K+-sensing histidine kinase KdpD
VAVAIVQVVAGTIATNDTCTWQSMALAIASLLAEAEQSDQRDTTLEESLSQLAALLKAPLARLQHQAQELRGDLADRSSPATAHDIALDVLAQADWIAECVATILDLQRLRVGQEPLDRKIVNVVELAQTTVAEVLARREWSARVRVVSDAQPEPRLCVDVQRLRQALGTVVERTSAQAAPGSILEVRISTDRTCDCARAIISIADGGARFVQPIGVRVAPVLGDVGLYHAREVVRMHGGDIWIEPRAGGGICRAVLVLPLDSCAE